VASTANRAKGAKPVQEPRRAGSRQSLDDTVALPGRGDDGVDDKLLMLIDGGGSYLLVRGGQASFGRVASDHPADIAMYSDIAERHANVTRVDEDYFLFGVKDVEVGGATTRHHLLRDGDKVTLGRKAKFTFRVPTRKCATAVLDLSDTTKMPHDVRRVVLFQKLATIGEGSHAHIRCRQAGPPLLLFEKDGGLWVRQHNDGHVDAQSQPLKPGEPVEIAGTRIVVEPWRIHPQGLSRIG
jgi:hypothetical protein